jgi:hypothetical protein
VLTYTTIDGQVIDLSDLSSEERAFFDRCYAAYEDNMPWHDFSLLAQGDENPVVRAAGRITRAVMSHPLYMAVRDLEDRVALRPGELEPVPGEQWDTEPVADEWLRMGAAVERKGVTVPGLHQAIQRGDVIARPAKAGGAWRVVSRNSLDRWTPSPVRQAAV